MKKKQDDLKLDKDDKRVEMEVTSDQFSSEEQDKIVRMVTQDIEADLTSMQDWIDLRAKDLEMYEGIRPSEIEDLDKESWMSDRNLGLTAANCDAYQSTLLATCYNIDTIHFQATEMNDVDRAEDLQKFSKWGLQSEKEANFQPQVDDFIHNKITQGISYFYVYWDVEERPVDRRIPVYQDPKNKKGFIKYRTETVMKRFEKGVIENIPDVSDLIFPRHGATLQEKPHIIHRVHKNAQEIVEKGKTGEYLNVTAEYVLKLRKHCYDNRTEILGNVKSDALGIKNIDDMTDDDLRLFPIDLFVWYGKYKKENGYDEEYRFIVEPETKKFLSGKPLRKINRSGKRPFVGRPLIRRPGLLQGTSLPRLIADPVNAMNATFNQKSDFQYVENCPFGWYNPDEGHAEQSRSLIPGKLFPTSDPDGVHIPNITRSMAWAESDYKLLFEIIERLTGAASYFMSNTKGVSGTATRDAIINEKSETRFSLMVNRIILDIAEAITMWIQLYQDWAPPDIGKRILGEDGKQLFPNFSIETISGGYDAAITPDIISGSKTLEKEIALWGLEVLSQTVWFSPQFNPKGNWHLVRNAAKKSGMANVDQLMPPEPPAQFGQSKSIKDKWTQLSQGEMPEIEPNEDVIALYMGFMVKAEESRHELDPEYIPNLDMFMFKLHMSMVKEIQRLQNEQLSTKLAMDMVHKSAGQERDPNPQELLNG